MLRRLASVSSPIPPTSMGASFTSSLDAAGSPGSQPHPWVTIRCDGQSPETFHKMPCVLMCGRLFPAARVTGRGDVFIAPGTVTTQNMPSTGRSSGTDPGFWAVPVPPQERLVCVLGLTLSGQQPRVASGCSGGPSPFLLTPEPFRKGGNERG